MSLEGDLRKEIEKWSARLEDEMKDIRILDEGRAYMLENIRAYMKDSSYFLTSNDLIRSFEALIWAWAWLSILKELKIVKS
ncbi:MAG: DUF357 domain-containing protein [Candidatus Aenigmarchaeota archaeon]|nr:DUF357 domain-containing protein [Candidatus Aenigmarchaeota archaeon]